MHKIPDKIIFWGGTGQAKVCRPIVEAYGSRLVAVIDDTPKLISPFSDVPVYCGWTGLLSFLEGKKEKFGFAVTIGNPHGRVRLKLHEKLVEKGLIPVTLIHPQAYVEKNAKLGEGCQIMAGAVVGAETTLGKQVIINTNASVDHENIIQDGCEVAPGATLCGNITLETNSWICAGAVVLPRLTIGADAVVGAGSVVTKDVPAKITVVGIPARELRKEPVLKAVKQA